MRLLCRSVYSRGRGMCKTKMLTQIKLKSFKILVVERLLSSVKMSLQGPSLRHCARETQLLSKKCCSGGEPLATLCPI